MINFANAVQLLGPAITSKMSSGDGRFRISPVEMTIGTILSTGPGVTNLGSIRELAIKFTDITGISAPQSTYWERLGSSQTLENLTSALDAATKLTGSMGTSFGLQFGCYGELADALGVKSMYLVDSTHTGLRPSARGQYPTTGTNSTKAAIKSSVWLDLKTGTIAKYEFTPGTTHDSEVFDVSEFQSEPGALLIFDLGYYDSSLFFALIAKGVYFLSRIKVNCNFKIEEVLDGGIGRHITNVSEVKKKVGPLIVCEVTINSNEGPVSVTLIGFWDKKGHRYLWYITNLPCEKHIIKALYRLRWQIELLFKSLKNSMGMSNIRSANETVIKSLLTSAFAGNILAMFLSNAAASNNPETKQGQTIERSMRNLGRISKAVYNYIVRPTKELLAILIAQAEKAAVHLFDPNFKKRETSGMRAFRFATQSI